MQKRSLLEGVVLYVGNLERAKAWYRDVLDLPLIREEEHVVHFDAGTVRLAIHTRNGSGIPPGDGFIVFGVEDVDGESAELRQRGAQVDGPKDRPYGRVAYVKDPEGHLIGLWQVPSTPPAADPVVGRFASIAARLSDWPLGK
jgi:predicted enzyme related to lactoylglutathione lyase